MFANSHEAEGHIKEELENLEFVHGIKILFATVAGSRLLGYSHPGSDYDVKFVYLRPITYYLQLPFGRQYSTIEMPGKNVSFSGWDVSKVLHLSTTSNPSLSEWIYGKDIWDKCPVTVKELRNLVTQGTNLYTLYMGYRGQGRSDYNKYIGGEEIVDLKQYLITIRSACCCSFIRVYSSALMDRHLSVMVWNLFSHVQDSNLYQKINTLIDLRKTSGNGDVPRDPEVDAFLLDQLFDQPWKNPQSVGEEEEETEYILQDNANKAFYRYVMCQDALC